MIVGVDDDETRERLLANAKKLAKKDKWKRTFVAEDMTPTQREEARKADEKTKKDPSCLYYQKAGALGISNMITTLESQKVSSISVSAA